MLLTLVDETQPSASNADTVPWTRRDMALSIGLAVVAVVAVLLGMMLGLALLQRWSGRSLPAQAQGMLVLFAELGLLAPVWAFGVRKYRITWSVVGFRGFNLARGTGLGCLALLASFAFNALWALLLGLFQLRTQPDVLPAFGGGAGGLSLALLVGGVVAPVAEEAFFRGFLFAGLKKYWGRLAGALLSAALFTVAHILPTSFPPIFVLGVLFALLYDYTGSIWPAVALHGVINSLSFVAAYLVGLM